MRRRSRIVKMPSGSALHQIDRTRIRERSRRRYPGFLADRHRNVSMSRYWIVDSNDRSAIDSWEYLAHHSRIVLSFGSGAWISRRGAGSSRNDRMVEANLFASISCLDEGMPTHGPLSPVCLKGGERQSDLARVDVRVKNPAFTGISRQHARYQGPGSGARQRLSEHHPADPSGRRIVHRSRRLSNPPKGESQMGGSGADPDGLKS